MLMPNGNLKLRTHGSKLGKLVSRGGSQAPVWMYARLGSRGKNSGPKGIGKHGTKNHIPPWPPIQALICPYHVQLSLPTIPRHPFILGSFAALIHQPDVSVLNG